MTDFGGGHRQEVGYTAHLERQLCGLQLKSSTDRSGPIPAPYNIWAYWFSASWSTPVRWSAIVRTDGRPVLRMAIVPTAGSLNRHSKVLKRQLLSLYFAIRYQEQKYVIDNKEADHAA